MKWTLEKLQEEADKYETRGEFWKNNHNAANSARKQTLMDKLFENHLNNGFCKKEPHNKFWNNDNLKIEAKKFKTIGEFQLKRGSAYNAARRFNIINDLFENHENSGYTYKQKKSGYWTLENLQEEANKYSSRQSFREKSCVYGIAKNKKTLDILFKNHQNHGYSEKESWKENNYLIYVYEIKETNVAYVGLTTNIIRRDREHLFNDDDKLYLYCKSMNLPCPKHKTLEKELTSSEAKIKEEFWINFYKNNNWNLINTCKAGSLGKIRIFWTKKKLQEEANKYKTRTEFAKNSSSA